MSNLLDRAEFLINAATDLQIYLKRGDLAVAQLQLDKVLKHHSIIAAIVEAVAEFNKPKAGPVFEAKRTGEMAAYIRRSLKNVKPGESGKVYATAEFSVERLAPSVSSVGRIDWGPGTYATTRVFGDKPHVLVTRTSVKRTADGRLSRYLRGHMADMEVGDVVAIPPTDEFPVSRLRAATLVGKSLWGTGSVKSTYSASEGVLVERLA